MILSDLGGFDFKRLPDVRGSYKKHVVMAPYTWFRVGGATTVFRPHDDEDLSQFLLKKTSLSAYDIYFPGAIFNK